MDPHKSPDLAILSAMTRSQSAGDKPTPDMDRYDPDTCVMQLVMDGMFDYHARNGKFPESVMIPPYLAAAINKVAENMCPQAFRPIQSWDTLYGMKIVHGLKTVRLRFLP